MLENIFESPVGGILCPYILLINHPIISNFYFIRQMTTVNPAENTTQAVDSIPFPDDSCWETLEKYPENEVNTRTLQFRSKETHEPPHKIYDQSEGYKVVALFDSKDPQGYHLEYEHRIIADHFLTNPDPNTYRYVDHKDRNKTNNNPSNLRFVSNSFNTRNRTHFRGNNCNYIKTLPGVSVRLKVDRYNCKGERCFPYLYCNGDVYEELRGGGESEFRCLPIDYGLVKVRMATTCDNREVWISMNGVISEFNKHVYEGVPQPVNPENLYEN
jgi:hypothetical protein